MSTLVESRLSRFSSLAILYLAQGLPFGLFGVAIPSWMASRGYSAAAIGSFVGMVWLPWSLKVLVAPLMDRFSYRPMGHRRPWVMGAQVGILVSSIALTLVPEKLFWLTVLACASNVFAAAHDVAVDGMAIDVLPAEERARANGFMFGGQFVGIALGTSGGGYALKYFGLAGVGLLGASVILVAFLVVMLVRERPGEKRLPWSSGQAHCGSPLPGAALVQMRQTLTALMLPVSLLLLLVQFGFRCAEGVVLTLMPVHTVQQLGWENVAYNDIVAAAGILAAVAGILLAPLIDRAGSRRAFWLLAGAKLAVLCATPGLIDDWARPLIMIHLLLSQLLTITIITSFMQICRQQVAATQFSIYMAASNLSYSAGAFVYGRFGGQWPPEQMLTLAIILAAAVLPLWFLVGRWSKPSIEIET